VALQDLATRLGMPIHVNHYPPGTSKWNKIERRMFCHITQHWRGRPLVSYEVIVNLIAAVTGLKIRAELDRATYPSGIKVTEAEFQTLHLKTKTFHGDWNIGTTHCSQSVKQNHQVIFTRVLSWRARYPRSPSPEKCGL